MRNQKFPRPVLHAKRHGELRAGVALCALVFGLSAQDLRAQDPLPQTKADWQQDTEYRTDWGLDAINAADAYAAGFTGLGVTVGVVDSGVFASHPEFADGRVKPVDISGTYYSDGYYQKERQDAENSWTAGQSFSTPGVYNGAYNDPHGTHVTGTIGASRDGHGMQGVAFDANVFVSNTHASDSNVAYGANADYNYFKEAYGAVAKAGARAINTSWGDAPIGSDYNSVKSLMNEVAPFNGKKTYIDAMAEVAKDYNLVQVVAAGNDSSANPDVRNSMPYFRPEYEKYWLSVGAAGKGANDSTAAKDVVRAVFSDRAGIAKYWFVFAPGVNITSTTPIPTGSEPWIPVWNPSPDGYGTVSGTSMSAPHATGALAVIMQRFPYLSASEARDVLLTTAYHRDAVDGTPDADRGVPNDVWGWGVIDLSKAIKGPGQFLGAFEANLGANTTDTWSNDISDTAIKARKVESETSIAAWDARKAALGLAGESEYHATPQTIADLNAQSDALRARYTAAATVVRQFVAGYADFQHGLLPYEQLLALFNAYIASPDAQSLVTYRPGGGSIAESPGDPRNDVFALSVADVDAWQTGRFQTFLSGLTAPDTFAGEFALNEAQRQAYLTRAQEGSLIKSGAGTLVLTGANSYTGGTTITGGVLQIGNGGTTGSVAGDIVDNAALSFNRSDSTEFAGNISGTGVLQQEGTGTLVLSGTNTYTGGTLISQGTLVAAGGSAIADSGTVTIAAPGQLALRADETIGGLAGAGSVVLDTHRLTEGADGSSTQFAGTISGLGGLTKIGAGRLTLTGENTYTGGTTITGGLLQIGNGGTTGSVAGDIVDNAALSFDRSDRVEFAGKISGTGVLQQDGTGTLVLTGENTYTGGTTITDGLLQIGNGGTTGSVAGDIVDNAALSFNRSDSTEFAGTISGTGVLLQDGPGTLVLSGANTYTGGTLISQGTLVAAGGSAIADSGTLAIAAPGQLALRADETIGGLAGAGSVVLDTHRLTEGADGSSTQFAGTISGLGGLTKTGSGLLTLTGANTYAGGTTISGGLLQIGNGGTTGSVAGDIVDNAALSFNRSDSTEFAGTISGTGVLLQDGPGTLVLSGANTYTGGTLISQGTLVATGGSAIADRGTVAIAAPGQLALRSDETIGGLAGVGSVVLDTHRLTEGADGSSTQFAGTISGLGGLTKTGSGLLTLTGANSYSGGTTITGGLLQIGNGGTTGSVAGDIVDNAALSFNRSDSTEFAGNISGTGVLQQEGTGTLVLSGTNTYTGGTSISQGTLVAAGGSAIADSGTVAIAAPGQLALRADETIGGLAGAGSVVLDTHRLTEGADGSSTQFAGTISGLGGLTKTGRGLLALTGANTYAGGTTITGGLLQIGNGGTTGSVAGDIVDNAALSFNRSDSTEFAGTISGTGVLLQDGPGTLVLSGANTYTGGTLISQGTLVTAGGSAIADRGTVAIAAPGQLALRSDETIGGLAGVGSIALDTHRLTEGADGSSTQFAGTISGLGGLTKTGAGRLNLTGNSSYSGATLVEAGLLSVNGSLAKSDVNVSSGAAIGGNGSVHSLNVASAGVVAPGNSVGKLAVAGDVTMASGSILQVELGQKGGVDQLSVGGHASMDGVRVELLKENTGLLLDPATFLASLGKKAQILTATGGVSGTLNTEVGTDFTFLGGVLTFDSNTISLTLGRNNKSFSGYAESANGRAVAAALDQLALGTPLHDAIVTTNAPQLLPEVFAGLSGSIHADMATTILEGSHALRDTALARALHRDTGDSSDGSIPVAADASGALTAYLQSLGSWGRRDGIDGNEDARSSTHGVLAGFDARFDPTWQIGVIGGYTDGNDALSGSGGSGSVKTYQAGIYGSGLWGDFGLRGGVAYGHGDIKTKRSFAVPGLPLQTETASYGGDTGQIFGEIGYQMGDTTFGIEPFANLALVTFHEGSFQESSGPAALRSKGLSDTLALQTIGVHLSSRSTVADTDIKATGMLGWRHSYGDGTPSAKLGLVSGGPSFSVEGTPVAEDAFVVNAGLEATLAKDLTVGVSYQGQLAGKSSENSFKADLKLKF